jgi:hypothetical protein
LRCKSIIHGGGVTPKGRTNRICDRDSVARNFGEVAELVIFWTTSCYCKGDINTTQHDHNTEAMFGSIEQTFHLAERSSKTGTLSARFPTTVSSSICNCEKSQRERPEPAEEQEEGRSFKEEA